MARRLAVARLRGASESGCQARGFTHNKGVGGPPLALLPQRGHPIPALREEGMLLLSPDAPAPRHKASAAAGYQGGPASELWAAGTARGAGSSSLQPPETPLKKHTHQGFVVAGSLRATAAISEPRSCVGGAEPAAERGQLGAPGCQASRFNPSLQISCSRVTYIVMSCQRGSGAGLGGRARIDRSTAAAGIADSLVLPYPRAGHKQVAS